MAALCGARLLITFVPFQWWKQSLGSSADAAGGIEALTEAQRIARQVDWGAERLPFMTKCLPRAIALSSILRRKRISHAVVIAARPSNLRGDSDTLHAWVEVSGARILGDLPGPWIETLRQGE